MRVVAGIIFIVAVGYYLVEMVRLIKGLLKRSKLKKRSDGNQG